MRRSRRKERPMGEQENRAMIERVFDLTQKGDMEAVVQAYHDDVVIEYPQSGEKIEGRKNALAVYTNFPEGTPSFTLREVRTSGDLAIAEHDGEYPDGSTWFATSIYEIRDGKVVRETDYFSQGFEAPEWRTQRVTKL
jgi:ketosteroid isomerase-like protein